MKRWLIIIGLAAVAGAGWFWLRTRPIGVLTVQPTVATVRESIDEDGKTRLDQEYIVAMPINGRVWRIRLEEGQCVTSGQVVATIDDFALRRNLEQLQAKIDEIQSLIVGVDTAKPKPEEIEAARLKVAEAQLGLENCRKEKSVTSINLAEAERDFQRMTKLLADGVVQQAQFDQAKRAYDTLRERLDQCRIAEETSQRTLEIARLNHQRIQDSVDDNEYLRRVYQAQIGQIQAQVRQLRDDLSKTEVCAPVPGVILDKFIEDERVLAAGTPLLKIGDMTTIEIESDILSEEVGRVRPGQMVGLTGKALGNRIVSGAVKRIYPGGFMKISALGIEQQRVKVIVAFDNSQLQLRPYVSVDVSIIVDEHKDVLTVPEQSVFKDEASWAVFVVEEGRLQRRPIEIGLRNENLVEIRGGLDRSDLVVAEPNNDLRPGLRVRPAS